MHADAEGWTPEREERLLALWNADWSAGRIAEELGGGLTRNAVIGKVHRLLERREEPSALPVAAKPRTGVKKRLWKPEPKVAPVSSETPSAAFPAPANAIPSSGFISDADMERLFRGPAPVRVGRGPVPLMDLPDNCCPYIVGDGPDSPRCGEPKLTGKCWCEAHHKAFTVKPPKGISSALPQHRRSGVRLG